MPIAQIFFDVDDTLIDWKGRLRPYAREVMAALVERDFAVSVWSGVGLRWEVVDAHNLRPFVSACYQKPLYRHRERLAELGIPVLPDYVIDDYEEVVAVFGGLCVPPWTELHGPDRSLLRVLEELQERFDLRPGFALLADQGSNAG